MKKALLIAIATSTVISASAMAAAVVCPSTAQVNAGLSKSSVTNQWTYQVGAFTQVTPGSLVQPTADAIVSQTNVFVYPTAMLYHNSMTCTYTSTMSSRGITLAYKASPVKANTAAAGNQWKTPENNGIYFCNSSVSAQCPALTK
ncbi:MAG: hypothetical protein Q8L78_00240 [Coxiellaceae bacterium]|nr:hypothetical protein [Coxiellaceae bacterium]